MSENSREREFRKPISKAELERRWKAVREAMVKERIDCLVMQDFNMYLGGYGRYFTDIPAESSYPRTVIFPVDDEMTLISHGGPPLPPSPPEWAVHGVKERIGVPAIHSLNFTNLMEPKAAVETIKRQKSKSLGFVSKGSMSASFYEYVKGNLQNVEMKDATDLVDHIRAIKSEEEIELIKKTVEMQDIIWGATLALVHPGVREWEIRSEIKHLLINMGSEEQWIMIGSAPAGSPAGHKSTFFQNRTLQYGDQVMIMIEVNGLGGFYGEIGRTVCIGEIPMPMQDAWNDAVELQDITVEKMKPGANPKELFEAHNKLLDSMGYSAEGRLYAHSQGYDMVERPAVRPEETMLIEEGMYMTIHPIAVTDKAYAFCCDNFLITNTGAVRMHKTPREVFVV